MTIALCELLLGWGQPLNNRELSYHDLEGQLSCIPHLESQCYRQSETDLVNESLLLVVDSNCTRHHIATTRAATGRAKRMKKLKNWLSQLIEQHAWNPLSQSNKTHRWTKRDGVGREGMEPKLTQTTQKTEPIPVLRWSARANEISVKVLRIEHRRPSQLIPAHEKQDLSIAQLSIN